MKSPSTPNFYLSNGYQLQKEGSIHKTFTTTKDAIKMTSESNFRASVTVTEPKRTKQDGKK